MKADGVPRVAYVMGVARSGSTLAASLLGNAPGCANVGELARLALVFGAPGEQGLCACREPVALCPFWREVAHRLQALGIDVSDRDAGQRHRQYERLRRVWSPSPHEVDEDYRRRESALLATLANTCGAATIVDSSKAPGRAATLSMICATTVVHLRRDPRAVVWSLLGARSRRTGRTRAGIGAVVVSSLEWLVAETSSRRVARTLGDSCIEVHYEELVVAPGRVLRPVWARLEIAPPPWVDDPEDRVVDPGHMVAGNRWRLGGPTRVSAREQWRTEMPTWQVRLVGALARLARNRPEPRRVPSQ